jgi:uncharacterized SAM-binding protein YcdF (DUF218 family)
MNGWSHWVSYSVLLSPMLFLITAIGGSLIALWWRKTGFAVTTVSLVVLYLASTPRLADALNGHLDAVVRNKAPNLAVGAIVVLGADVERVRGRNNPVELGPISLRRVVLAAEAYRRTGLPILVSGGPISDSPVSLADLMGAAFTRDFAIPVRWRERRSQNTYQNAEFSARILKAAGIKAILLVSQARDIPRAAWAFRHFGIAVKPASAPVPWLSEGGAGDFLPSPKALLSTFYAIHELLGYVYYLWAYD